jgi:endonuclease/exonuclease/phosphatase family metal-dependent hydrolase
LKKIFIICLLCMLVWSCAIDNPDNGEESFPSFGGGDTLDIVTWNLNLFPKNGTATMQYMEDAIRDMRPDIIAFQEISSGYYLNMLASRLGDFDAYLGEGGGNWGLAYLYRSDLLELDTAIYEIYTDHSRPFPRPPLIMEARWKGNSIVIINNHLKASGDGFIDPDNAWDEERRRQEAIELLDEYIREHFDDRRVVVLGDMNDELTDPPARNVFQLMLEDTAAYYFTDFPIALGSNLYWSYPSWPSHIDHTMITNELFGIHYETKTLLYDTYLDGRWNEYNTNISDHRPVSISLIMGEED